MNITREQYNTAVANEIADTIVTAQFEGHDLYFLKKYQKALIVHFELVGRRLFHDGPEDRVNPLNAPYNLSPTPGGCVSVPDGLYSHSEQLESELEPRPEGPVSDVSSVHVG
jgi:hypothetical protein